MPLSVLFHRDHGLFPSESFSGWTGVQCEFEHVGAGRPSKEIQGHTFFLTFSVGTQRQHSDTQEFKQLVRRLRGHWPILSNIQFPQTEEVNLWTRVLNECWREGTVYERNQLLPNMLTSLC